MHVGRCPQVPRFDIALIFFFSRRIARELASHPVRVFSGIYSPLALILHKPSRGTDIYYCHSPARHVHDLESYWADQLPKILRPAFRIYCRFFRWFEGEYVKKFDAVIANSREVAKRIKDAWDLEAIVIPPPADIASIKHSRACSKSELPYFVSTARHERYKRVDLIIEAFKGSRFTLKVISYGSQTKMLQRLAHGHPNIEMVGAVSREQLASIISGCRATIYIPVREDFGISVIESLALGRQVIIANSGGPVENIVQGETGYIIPEPLTAAALREVVEAVAWDECSYFERKCICTSESFSETNFTRKISALIESLQVDNAD